MTGEDWQPATSIGVLRQRAALLDAVREFFRARQVLEVETPAVVAHAVTDVQIDSLTVASAPLQRFLHTSPEYAMKRLLAAGSGDIFQICRVYRAGERSRLHNPEFTMVEWYRRNFDLPQIMTETAELVATLFGRVGRRTGPVEFLTYQSAFRATLGCDPLAASDAELRDLCLQHGLVAQHIGSLTRDDLLDFLVAVRVGPQLGRERLTCLHHFPASQAALARTDATHPGTALRFELYAEGIELANGYVELADAAEQRRRFHADLAERGRRGLAQPAADERLIGALQAGLPPCAGVALGFDRVVMLALGAASIDVVMAFPWEKA